jgi:hypothetical protein
LFRPDNVCYGPALADVLVDIRVVNRVLDLEDGPRRAFVLQRGRKFDREEHALDARPPARFDDPADLRPAEAEAPVERDSPPPA